MFLTKAVSLSVSVHDMSCQMLMLIDPWDMLNNFCFHVYAQKLSGCLVVKFDP